MRTVDAYRALLDVEMTLAKAAHPDPRAAFLSLERRLSGEFRRRVLPRARTAVSAAGAILEAGGARKVSELRMAAALDAVAVAFVGLGTEVEPVVREVIRASYVEAQKRVRAQVVRKARTAAQLATSLEAVDRDAVKALTRHQVYWVGNAYEAVSPRIAAVSRAIVEQGVSSREAGKALQQALTTHLGLSRPGAQQELFAPTVAVPRGWNGTAIQYFDALAANTVNVARSIGAVRAFRDVGATHLQIQALGDERTCELCHWMNGKVFEVEGAAALGDQLVAAKTPDEVRTLKPWLHLGRVLKGSGLTRADAGQIPQAKMGRLSALGMHLTPFHMKCRCVENVAAVGDFSVLVPDLPAPPPAPTPAPTPPPPSTPAPAAPAVPRIPVTSSDVQALMSAVRADDDAASEALAAIRLVADRAGARVDRTLSRLAVSDPQTFMTVVSGLQQGRLPSRRHPLYRLLARHLELERRRTELLKRRADLRAQVRAQVHRMLLESKPGRHGIGPAQVQWGVSSDELRWARSQMAEAVDFVSRVVRRSSYETHAVRVNIFHLGDPRAWAEPIAPGRVSAINCHVTSRVKSYVHELGHTIEFSDPAVQKRLNEFYAARTKGERLKRLSRVTGRNYGPKEVTRVDRFADPYMGRDYGTGNTELLSMGLEFLFTDPVELALRDPELFDLVVAILKGVEP